jgi:hypothetical protein
MPSDLWTEAAALGRRFAVYGVARALGVNYDSLRRRIVEGAGGNRGEGGRPRGAFVELPGVSLVAPGCGAPVLELEDGAGVRLTVRLPAGADLDLAVVVRAFRGCP